MLYGVRCNLTELEGFYESDSGGGVNTRTCNVAAKPGRSTGWSVSCLAQSGKFDRGSTIRH